MGLSLAEAAVRGNTSDIAEEKQMLLAAGDTEGLIRLNRTIFGGATMMAKEDDADDDADDDDDDDEDEDDDGDDDDDDDSDGKGKKKPDPKDERIKELSAEAKKHRLKAVSRGKRVRELEAEIAELKKGSKPKGKPKDDEDDDADAEESEELQAEREKNKTLQARIEQQTLRTEFNDLLAAPKQKIKFIDPKAAFRLLDLDDVEIDEEDGTVEGMEDAIKALAKKSPYLLVQKKDEDDEDDEDEDPKPRRTGQQTSRTRKGGKTANRDALIKKYGIKR